MSWYTRLGFSINTTGVILKCKGLIIKVYIPGFIVNQMLRYDNFIEAKL